MVPDAPTLLALLGGASRLIRDYDLTQRDEIEALAGAIQSAMEDADIHADLDVVADAAFRLRAIVSRAALIRAGRALLAPARSHTERELRAKHAVEQVFLAGDGLAAVVVLARGIDPYGGYRVVRARRAA